MIMSDFSGTAEFRRSHGVHSFETDDKMPVVGISAASWEEFEATISDLPQTDGYIITPELITSPVPLKEIPALEGVVQLRQQRVAELSRRHPWARIVLGTALFLPDGIYNGAQAYHDGNLVGQYKKQSFTFDGVEAIVFKSGEAGQNGAFSIASHELLICSDLIGLGGSMNAEMARTGDIGARSQRYLSPATRSLIVMSCWGTPMRYLADGELEARAQSVLERAASAIVCPGSPVKEIIMVDRSVDGTGLEPFNMHMKAQSAAVL